MAQYPWVMFSSDLRSCGEMFGFKQTNTHILFNGIDSFFFLLFVIDLFLCVKLSF